MRTTLEIEAQRAIAAIRDTVAMANGCSARERAMRLLGPQFYHGSADLREFCILLNSLADRRHG